MIKTLYIKEDNQNIEKIAKEFKDELFSKCKGEIKSIEKIGNTKVEVKYSTKENKISVWFDTPRWLRHPDEYATWETTNHKAEEKEISQAEDKVWDIINQYTKKYKDIKFSSFASSSGNWTKVY